METSNVDWVNNECGDFMWDEALNSAEFKVNFLTSQEKNISEDETIQAETTMKDNS